FAAQTLDFDKGVSVGSARQGGRIGGPVLRSLAYRKGLDITPFRQQRIVEARRGRLPETGLVPGNMRNSCTVGAIALPRFKDALGNKASQDRAVYASVVFGQLFPAIC